MRFADADAISKPCATPLVHNCAAALHHASPDHLPLTCQGFMYSSDCATRCLSQPLQLDCSLPCGCLKLIEYSTRMAVKSDTVQSMHGGQEPSAPPVRADGCIAGALHTAAQRMPEGAPSSLRKSASDVASLSVLGPGQSTAQDCPGGQAPLSRRASCTEATMAAERSRRPSFGDDPSSAPSGGWNPLLRDLPGNFLLVPDPVSQAGIAGIPCPEGVAIPQPPNQSLSRKESFESVRARSLQRDDSSFSNQNSSPASIAASSLVSQHQPLLHDIDQPWHAHRLG